MYPVLVEVILFFDPLVINFKHWHCTLRNRLQLLVGCDFEYLLYRVVINNLEPRVRQPKQMLHHDLWVIYLYV